MTWKVLELGALKMYHKNDAQLLLAGQNIFAITESVSQEVASEEWKG